MSRYEEAIKVAEQILMSGDQEAIAKLEAALEKAEGSQN